MDRDRGASGGAGRRSAQYGKRAIAGPPDAVRPWPSLSESIRGLSESERESVRLRKRVSESFRGFPFAAVPSASDPTEFMRAYLSIKSIRVYPSLSVSLQMRAAGAREHSCVPARESVRVYPSHSSHPVHPSPSGSIQVHLSLSESIRVHSRTVGGRFGVAGVAARGGGAAQEPGPAVELRRARRVARRAQALPRAASGHQAMAWLGQGSGTRRHQAMAWMGVALVAIRPWYGWIIRPWHG
jgi:hypothetical protein